MPKQKKPSATAGFTDHNVVVTPEFTGQRLDKALTLLLADKSPGLSRARIQSLIAAGLLASQGKPIDNASRKVKEGESFTLRLPPPEAAVPLAQKMPLTIVYEDKDLLVIDKPVGMVVHPAPGNRDKTLVNALLAHCGTSLSGIGGVARPGIVHRLDKDTSGLMVVAKNDKAHQELSRQFGDRTLSRTYRAIIWGVPIMMSGEIDAPIGRHHRDRKKMAVSGKGKQSLTRFRVLETFETASFIECNLATGRTHQIRVHLAHVKHPVVGDPVYGKQKSDMKAKKAEILLRAFARQALHAIELQFQHPRSGKKMRFKSELPKDMAKLLRHLRETEGV